LPRLTFKPHSCTKIARRNTLLRDQSAAPHREVELELNIRLPPSRFQTTFATARARLTPKIQLTSKNARSSSRRHRKEDIRVCALSLGFEETKKCAQSLRTDVCGCSFLHVLRPGHAIGLAACCHFSSPRGKNSRPHFPHVSLQTSTSQLYSSLSSNTHKCLPPSSGVIEDSRHQLCSQP
jgi:hypothetical protein